MTILVLFLILAVALTLSPLIPLWFLVPALILVRALSDWGQASGESPIPAGLISATVGLIFLGAVLLPGARVVPLPFALIGLATSAWCALFVAVAIVAVDSARAPIEEAVRLMSVVAVVLVVSRCSTMGLGKITKGLLWAVLVPATYQIVAWFVPIPGTTYSEDRLSGTFAHANSAATYFAVGVLFAWAVARRSPDVLPRVVAVLSFIAMLTTQSLGAIVALMAAAIAVRLLAPGESIGRRLGKVVLLLAVALALLIAPPIAARLEEFSRLQLNVTGTSQDSGNSFEWRIINWSRLMESWTEAPWFGHGLSATSTYIMPMNSSPHSAPVQLLVETGLVGFLSIVAGLLFLAFWAWKRVSADGPAGNLVLGIIGFAVVNGSESNLLNYSPALYLVAAVCAVELTRAWLEVFGPTKSTKLRAKAAHVRGKLAAQASRLGARTGDSV